MELLKNLHPELVHFPIALFFIYSILEASGIILKKDYYSNAATMVLFVGLIFALLAVLTGNKAEEFLKTVTNSKEILNTMALHRLYATILLWYFTFILFLKIYLFSKKKLNFKNRLLILLLSLIGLFFVYQVGKYGGKMVYEYGVGTKVFNGIKIK